MKNNTVTEFLISHAKSICFAFLLITIACAWLMRLFEINATAETLLVKDNALYLESRIYNQRFAPEEFVLVGYRPHDGALFSEQSMEQLHALSNDLSTLERVEQVNAITNVPLISSGSSLTADINPQELTWENQGYDSQELVNIFSEHPIYTDLLVNADQTATALQIVFREDQEFNAIDKELLELQLLSLNQDLSESQKENMESLERIKQGREKILSQMRNNEIRQIYEIVEPYKTDADIFLGGNYVLAFHLVEIITQDLLVFGVAILVIVGFLLLLIFRNLHWLFLPILCCLISVVITTGLFGALGFKATVISSNFIALQLILTLAIVIHLIVHYQYLSEEHESLSHKELLIKTVVDKAKPCFFAGLTTSVGFAALLISGLQPVITFGWMMIVAMIVSISTSLVLFPCTLGLVSTKLGVYRPEFVRGLLSKVHVACMHRQRLILVLSGLFGLIMALGVFRLETENSFINYFSESTQIRNELAFIDTELGGSTPLDIIYHPQGQNQESENLVLESQDAELLQAIQESIERSQAVGKVMSVVNFTLLARELNEGKALTEYELNSLYTLIDTGLREQLLGAYVDQDRSEYRISARIVDTTPNLDRQVFLDALRNTMNDLGVQEENYTLTNLFVLYQDILQRLVDSQIKTIALVFLALWGVMVFIFRSPGIAAIALVPNIIVTLMILGVMGWLSIPLDLMTITIAAIAMGIAVDDTIHFVHHFQISDELAMEKRLQAVFRTVGYALVYTSFVIAVGFSVLGFSDFVPSIIFGLLTCLAILAALIIDLLLLPVLLIAYIGAFGKAKT